MKKIFILTVLAVVFVVSGVNAQGAAQSLDAQVIVEKSRDRILAETVSTRYRMVITARNGAVSERVMDQYSKDDSSGNSRMVIVFQSPVSVSGTRFLTIENQDRANDQWIFLPSLNRVRRIAASEGSGSFVGTDFSYDDLSSTSRSTDLDNHRLLGEEKLNDLDCYMIESTPKEDVYQYSRMIQWIDKEDFNIHKVELYDGRGTLVKLLEILDYREVQGRLSPHVTKMTTLAAGTSTALHVEILNYDSNIPESVFTTNYLETGRP